MELDIDGYLLRYTGCIEISVISRVYCTDALFYFVLKSGPDF